MTSGVRAGLAALATSLLFAASAGAQDVTLGRGEVPPPPKGGGLYDCIEECPGETVAQQSSLYTSVAPASGVITSWRVGGFGPVSLRVLEPATGGRWTGAGTSAPATELTGESNPTELSISAGDLVGVDLGSGGAVWLEQVEAFPTEAMIWRPNLEEGESRSPKDQANESALFNAQEELTPVVTSVSPAAGSTAGGQTVTITGKYLSFALNVVFGSHPATTFSDLDGEHITATTPASSAGTVDVEVSNLHSTSEPVAADRYTFVGPASAAGPSTPGGGGSGQGASPTVTGFKESSNRWRRGSALPHVSSTPVGTTFAFSLNEPGTVSLTFVRVTAGRRAGRNCVAPSHANHTKPKCKRFLPAGSLGVSGHQGLNKVGFQGRLSRIKKLSPGNYAVSVTARDAQGFKSLTPPLTFTVVA